ncbi:putative gustatory receptor 2a isoform X1 [Drosophila subpulchrella]|uniref:putative gustatory receptor 2a isoform X1 n=1 Tax=Drosophila subpulchrella TaxID=1486046 RepID=UPI0018A1935C|nr:putative gustatory receptor 2a isoform X1 [Drosophila subpulchrella]
MDTLRALDPLHRVCQVCNLWPWRLVPPPDTEGILLRRSRWLELYGWTVLTVASGFTAYGLFRESSVEDKSQEDGVESSTISNIGHTVDFIQLVGMRVAHLAALLEALWQRQVQRDFYAELGEIDHQLSEALRVDVEGVRLQMRRQTTRRAVWMLWGYAVSQFLILGAKLLAPGHRFPVYWISYLLPMLVCGLRYFQIFTATQIVRQRLDVLLVALQQLQLQQKSPAVDAEPEEHAHLEHAAMERLMAVRLVYQRVWALVALLNRCYGLSMLMQVGNDFLAITSNCYWMFLNFRQSSASPLDILQIVASALWSAPHLGNVLVLSLLCDRTAQCATRLALCLHQVDVDLRNESHNALVSTFYHSVYIPLLIPFLPQITQFSLQLLHQRLHFSAAGFFNVDCTLLYTIVGATTTYLIILIQFHMSESSMGGGSNGG